MLKLTHKLQYPDVELGGKIVKVLNSCDNTVANLEFVTTIPRHVNIHVEIPNESKLKDILELGVLIGTLEKY